MDTKELKKHLSAEKVLAFYNCKKASNHLYYCPIHETSKEKHNPSLLVKESYIKCMSPARDCFNGCADIFQIIAKLENLSVYHDFKSILNKAKNIANFKSSFIETMNDNSCILTLRGDKSSFGNTQSIRYLERIGITESILRDFNIKIENDFFICPQILNNLNIGYKYIGIKKKLFFFKGGNAGLWYQPFLKQKTHLIFVEGEKDYLRLYSELKQKKLLNDYSIITLTNGAGTIPSNIQEIVSSYEPTHISIFYDNDDAGYKGSIKLAKILNSICKEVSVYKFPLKSKDKYDLSDFLNEGNSFEDLWSLETINYSDISSDPIQESASKLNITNTFSLKFFIDNDAPKFPWLIDQFMPQNKLCAIIAAGGVGKSWFLLQLAISIATGEKFIGLKNLQTPKKVLYISGEEDSHDIHRRVKEILKINKDLQNNTNIDNLNFMCLEKRNNHHMVDRMLFLENLLQVNKCDVLILDPIIRFINCDENNSVLMTKFIEKLEHIVDSGVSVIFSHHINKSSLFEVNQHSARGSSAITDAIRWNLALSKISKSEIEKYEFSNGDKLKPNFLNSYISAEIVKTNIEISIAKNFVIEKFKNGPLFINFDLFKKN